MTVTNGAKGPLQPSLFPRAFPLLDRGGEPQIITPVSPAEPRAQVLARSLRYAQAELFQARAAGAGPAELARLERTLATSTDALSKEILSSASMPDIPTAAGQYARKSFTRAGLEAMKRTPMPPEIRAECQKLHADIDRALDQALKQAWSSLPPGPPREALLAELKNERQLMHSTAAVLTGDLDRTKLELSGRLASWTARGATIRPDEAPQLLQLALDAAERAFAGDPALFGRMTELLRGVASRSVGPDKKQLEQATALLEVTTATLEGTPAGDARALAGLATSEKQAQSPELAQAVLSARIELLGRRGQGSVQAIEASFEALEEGGMDRHLADTLRVEFLDAGYHSRVKNFHDRPFVKKVTADLIIRYGGPISGFGTPAARQELGSRIVGTF